MSGAEQLAEKEELGVSHAGVQIPCAVTIMLVSAALHKQDLQITLQLLSHPARLTLGAASP